MEKGLPLADLPAERAAVGAEILVPSNLTRRFQPGLEAGAGRQGAHDVPEASR